MRILGIAGLVLALAVVGYLVVSYMGGVGITQEALQAIPGAESGSTTVDPTKRGLEQRLAPILDQERRRVEEAGTAAAQ